MQVKTISSFRALGMKVQIWKVLDQYFCAEIYGDGVCQLFRSNDRGAKLSDNLVGHNTHGVGDCKRAAREMVSQQRQK